MKKLIFAIALVSLLGVVVWMSISKKQSARSNNATNPQAVTTTTESNDSPTHYLNYSSDLLTSEPNSKFVLFFYANWCPTCRPIHSELMSRDLDIPNDTIVLKVNYNDNETDAVEKELAYKYGVTYQHTFVQIDSSGKEIKKWQGGGLDEIIKNTN